MSDATPSSEEAAVCTLAERLLRAWNGRDAEAFAACFAEDGSIVGYDGTVVEGRTAIQAVASALFRRVDPPNYVTATQRVHLLQETVAVLRSIGGLYSPAEQGINPMLNATQTILAHKQQGVWRTAHAQTTPTALSGRPEQVAQMLDELQRALDAQAQRTAPRTTK